MSRPSHRSRASSGDSAPVAELLGLSADAVRAQVRQLQKALEKLGAGRYGLGAAARDLGESTGRALTLSADLLGLFSRSLLLPRSRKRSAARKVRPEAPTEPAASAPPDPAPDPAPRPARSPARRSAAPGPPRKMGAREKAERFLTESLGAAERHSKEILRLARAEGISESTLQRAKRRLGVRSRREGFGPESRVFWKLPPQP